MTEDPLDRQVIEIAKVLRCAVCQNQPVAESNSDLARDMRAVIRDQLQAGKSSDEIIAYFVDRYGDYVLLNPPTSGPGVVVWVMPGLLLLLVGVSGFFYLRHRLRASLPPPPTLSKEDAARVRAAREQGSK